MKELELYKMYVAEPVEKGSSVSSTKYGFMTSKPVNGDDLLAIAQYYNTHKLDSSALKKTLFTKSELTDVSLINKIYKQLLHYISGGNFGTQTFEHEGRKFTFDIVQIVTKEELLEAIEKDIYNSKPLSEEKVKGIYDICAKYEFKLDYTKIKNNEFKAILLLNATYKFNSISGDDVLRAIIKEITGNTLLIKSKSVIEALYKFNNTASEKKVYSLLVNYSVELSQVFNRHKKLILALKNNSTSMAYTINKISKLSKKNHVPIKPALNKIFFAKYMNASDDTLMNIVSDLKKLTTIDKLKLINHAETLLSGLENRVFIIRNGKVFIKEEDYKTRINRVKGIKKVLLKSLIDNDLKHLKGKVIKYPENIDYGLPISEKKSVGHLPFNTTFYATNKEMYLVAGMYWENRWGAHDLDLSTVSISGKRVGWGQVSTYSSGVLFSGDITNAPDGAIEYIANESEEPVILLNNLYSGNSGSKFKVVVGESSVVSRNQQYFDNSFAELDSKFTDSSKCMSIGALYEDKFVLYSLSLGNKAVSSKKDKAVLPYMLVEHMKLKELLEMAGATITTSATELMDFIDVDLSLENVTFDKLSNLLTEEIKESKVVFG